MNYETSLLSSSGLTRGSRNNGNRGFPIKSGMTNGGFRNSQSIMLDQNDLRQMKKKSNAEYVRESLNKDVQWKQRVITILQNAKIASADDLQELRSLIGV